MNDLLKNSQITSLLFKASAIALLVLLGEQGHAQTAPKPGMSIAKSTGYAEASHRNKYRFANVTGPVRRGQRAQRFEIRHGDCGRSSGWNDCNTDRQRIERKEQPKNSFSKPNTPTWYGYSILLPRGFEGFGDTSTTIGQVKTEKMLVPIWWISVRDRKVMASFANHKWCEIGRISDWSGRWMDVMVYADYRKATTDTSIAIYVNGGLKCSKKGSLIPSQFGNQPLKLGFKYGIYNSFVSRWLQRNATKPVNLTAYKQTHEQGSSNSPTGTPFKYDWGIKLPTLVVYYDEMRSGPTRDSVDVRHHEKIGVKPVD